MTNRYNYNEIPDIVKRFNKEAKAYVRDHPVHQKKEENFSFEMTEALALSLSNANEEGYNDKKKKLSPRSNQRAQKIAKRRLAEYRKEILLVDDEESMKKLSNVLKTKRKDEDVKKKNDKKEQKEKFLLEEDK